jgi:DNA-binding transcriptional MerR regulator
VSEPGYVVGVETGLFRIGELSRRTGVSVDVIRAWERRYQLLTPARSEANFRLYSAEDLARLRLMSHYVKQHIAPSRAAELVHRSKNDAIDVNPGIPQADVRSALRTLRNSLECYDDAPAGRLLQRLVSVFPPAVVLRDAVLPYLGELGDRWQKEEVSVAQEHFASCFLESWILTVARGYGRSDGRRAVLACLPGERHCLGLAAFGLALRDLGWRVTYLGGDTPLRSAGDAAGAVRADVIVLAGVMPEVLAASVPDLGTLDGYPVVLGGPATRGESVPGLALPVLPADLLVAAHGLAAHARGGVPGPAPAA